MPACIMLVCIVLVCIMLAACGTPGAPMPPELELARPVTDLRAARKGDRVFLAWTVPAQTADHQTVRHPGPACSQSASRSAQQHFAKQSAFGRNSSGPVSGTAFDSGARRGCSQNSGHLCRYSSPDLQTQNPTAQITYTLSVLNESGRSAGFPTWCRFLPPTLSPPENFSATAKSDGVLLLRLLPATGEGDPHIGHRCGSIAASSQNKTPHHARKNQRYRLRNCSQPQHSTRLSSGRKVTTFRVRGHGRSSGQAGGGSWASTSGCSSLRPRHSRRRHQRAVGQLSGGPGAICRSGLGPDTDADLAGYNIFRREDSSQPGNSTLIR